MTNSTGTCSVIANQAGNTDYSAASPVTKTVNALGPLVKLSTSSINFGTLYKGESASQNITVTNIGTEPLIVNDPFFSIVKGGDSSEFSALNFCRWPLAPGKSCTIVINFCAGPYYTLQTATLQIMDNAPGDPQEVSLGALVIDPHVRFDPWNVDFGRVKHGTSSTMNVILRNPGGTPLIFSGAGIGITGQNSADFVETNNCGKSLAAGAECSIAIKFTPTSRGTFCANLTVVDNDRRGGGTQNIQLAGRGD
jgi:hypothetical protein